MLVPVRTTIRLDDDLLLQAKSFAARQHRTLTSLVEQGLRQLLREASIPARERTRLPVSTKGGGLVPGVDLDDSAALLDIMDEPRRPNGR